MTPISSPTPIYEVVSMETIVPNRRYGIRSYTFEYAQITAPVELNPLKDLINYINNFKNVKDNWDGMGAITPSVDTITNTISFLKLLPIHFQKILNTDDIEITPYGTIVLEWKNTAKYLISVELGKTKIGYFSKTSDGKDPYVNSLDFDPNDSIPSKILDTFQMVF